MKTLTIFSIKVWKPFIISSLEAKDMSTQKLLSCERLDQRFHQTGSLRGDGNKNEGRKKRVRRKGGRCLRPRPRVNFGLGLYGRVEDKLTQKEC